MTAKEPYWLYIIWEINGSICRNDSIMLKKDEMFVKNACFYLENYKYWY